MTGHTGFKGAWLTLWLARLGARVTGFSLAPPSQPSAFEAMGISSLAEDLRGDIREMDALIEAFERSKPEIVFHLAAQALVMSSFEDPKLTFDTNAGGTVNVLECLRRGSSVRSAVLITSDKCYANQEWLWGYRENDMLGGHDPYSASKACAEAACHAYACSFLGRPGSPRLATARAGNVIGGGDWARDRIVPDCVRAWNQSRPLELRHPEATRPWQHVLEPLSGYLHLGERLLSEPALHAEAFNFGPSQIVHKPVSELVDALQSRLGAPGWLQGAQPGHKMENTYLHLNCDKARHMLGWSAILGFADCVRLTAQWYKAFRAGSDMSAFGSEQIAWYEQTAREAGLAWATEAA